MSETERAERERMLVDAIATINAAAPQNRVMRLWEQLGVEDRRVIVDAGGFTITGRCLGPAE
jgi:hypothetical protein